MNTTPDSVDVLTGLIELSARIKENSGTPIYPCQEIHRLADLAASQAVRDTKQQSDTFRGDNDNLLGSIRALLNLDADNALFPHGIGGHARTLLESCVVRLSHAAAQAATGADWRSLALQFDGHRMQALANLKMLLENREHEDSVRVFLAAPPLPGEKILAERIAALSAPQGAQEQAKLKPLRQRAVQDAIRGAYDLGYSDARNARTVSGDGAPGYKGRDVEIDHGGALMHRLDQLAAPPSQQGEVRPEHIEKLLHAWEQRSSSAFPADAMLINKHIRELREVCGAQNTKDAGQPSLSLTAAPQTPAAVAAPKNEKDEFAAWAENEEGFSANAVENVDQWGYFVDSSIRSAWAAWQARAAIAAQEGGKHE